MKVNYEEGLGVSNKTGILGVLALILIIGVIIVININGIATTVVVIDELDNKKTVEEMATSYLNTVYEKVQNKYFFDQLGLSNIPPLPLTSEYTGSGNYSVETEINILNDHETEIIMTYKRSSDTSFDKPILVASTIVKNPERSYNQDNEE